MYRLAKQRGLQKYIVNQMFDPAESFLPPGFVFDEEKSNAILANSGTKAEKFPSARVYQAIEGINNLIIFNLMINFDWLIDWLIDRLFDWLMHWLIDGSMDWLIDFDHLINNK